MNFSTGSDSEALAIGDLLAAARHLRHHAALTPLLESPILNARIGGRLLIKAEVLQVTGSFKFRGALNRLSLIPEGNRTRGVVAYSSGNHAQGVAAAARLLEMPALIVMPSDAPALKIANTRALGAEIVLYDRHTESREAIGERLAAERAATLVRPYDDPAVMAGQGTVGLELATQAQALQAEMDAVLVPCGGGGLIAGCATALAEHAPDAKVYSVEPLGFDDTARSLVHGMRLANDGQGQSFCDALQVPTPGELTFRVNRRLLAGGLTVTDAEVADAMRAAFDHLKLVIEPSGAVALAAALAGKLETRGKTIAVIASGGNVERALFQAILGDAS